jgi:hypothetical protein
MRYQQAAIAGIVLGLILTAGPAWAGQWIVGSVSIVGKHGQNLYGERLAVFLVRTESPVSTESCGKESHRQRRLDCINNSHLRFYKQFQEKQRDADYLIAQTVTSETGNFAFFDVPVGTCYVLIKFPSMIDGYKVAWQEPVAVTPGRSYFVTLNQDNLVLPKSRRR